MGRSSESEPVQHFDWVAGRGSGESQTPNYRRRNADETGNLQLLDDRGDAEVAPPAASHAMPAQRSGIALFPVIRPAMRP
jgi:hypothetical protein